MRFSSRAVRHRLNSTSATAGITRKATSSWRRAIKLFLEPAEPGIGESVPRAIGCPARDRKSTRLNSSHLGISYAVFCLKKKKRKKNRTNKKKKEQYTRHNEMTPA